MPPVQDLDLDAYLARIGYSGPREPSLAVLKALHSLQPAAIAFENLSPLMGERVRLDVAELQAKMVRGGRGGYCYEQNGLFMAALEALGFSVTGLAARIRWGVAEDAPPRPRTHMALKIDLPEGPFLADVGFGGMVMTGPLRLTPGPEQETPHERYRLVAMDGAALELEAEIGKTWRSLYRFDLVPHMAVDYEPLNWFSATHPTSPFPTTLMAARALPDRRLALANTRFTIRRRGEAAEERHLKSLGELGEVLTRDFGLILPEGFERIGPKLGLV